jgi:hypothetical protein
VIDLQSDKDGRNDWPHRGHALRRASASFSTKPWKPSTTRPRSSATPPGSNDDHAGSAICNFNGSRRHRRHFPPPAYPGRRPTTDLHDMADKQHWLRLPQPGRGPDPRWYTGASGNAYEPFLGLRPPRLPSAGLQSRAHLAESYYLSMELSWQGVTSATRCSQTGGLMRSRGRTLLRGRCPVGLVSRSCFSLRGRPGGHPRTGHRR